MQKIMVGMSGGVDSSVTAWLLKEQGFEVEGVSFILYEARMKSTFSGCCSIASINDAKRTAEYLGLRHSVLDLRDEFMSAVIEPFIATYCAGTTPNPCILCNKFIKFPYLNKLADERGARYISTGHYARTERGTCLKKGVDPKKDQSYVLYVLEKTSLERLVLPLGDRKKDEVREIAAGLGLPAAGRPESQEICFIEDNKYFRLFGNSSGSDEGPVINAETGKVLGRHKGIHLFTPGQRKRLGIATGKPLYIVRIDSQTKEIFVGPKEMAMKREFIVEDVNWLNAENRTVPFFRASVRVRSTMKDEPACIETLDESSVRVAFDEPQWAPAPGQSAVFYIGETVIGGGIIK